MPRLPKSHPFDTLAAYFAKVVSDRLSPLLAAASPRRGPGRPKGSVAGSKLRRRKLDMRCRYTGCKNRSKGPWFRFLCEEHLKLPKAEQRAKLEKCAVKHR